MKHIGLTLLLSFTVLLSIAQKGRADSLQRFIAADTVVVEDVDTGEKRKVRILVPGEDEGIIQIEDEEKTHNRRMGKEPEDCDECRGEARPIYGITFSRIDLGLVKLIDNGSFTLSDNNRDFRYRPGKTVNFGLDVLQAGDRLNDHFRTVLSVGFDWAYLRLRGH